jgi:protoporphyrinogen oxidase
VRRLEPLPPAQVVSAAQTLRYRGVVLLYVAFDTPRIGDADTYYFPERSVPFNRVVEQKNFSACMAPPDSTVLCLDISCEPDDEVWDASDAELLERVLPSLQAVGLVRDRSLVREVFSRRFRHAYPIYDLHAAERLRTVENWLGRLANLWPIGRQGLYLHNNTHHSLLMGYRAAQLIGDQARDRWPQALAEFATFRVAD